MSRTRKNFDLKTESLEKLEQLRLIENSKLEEGELASSHTSVIHDAIDFYHSHVFGNQAIDHKLEQLKVVLTNVLKVSNKEYSDVLFEAVNHLIEQNKELIKELEFQTELELLIMRSVGTPREDTDFKELISGNRKFESIIRSIIE